MSIRLKLLFSIIGGFCFCLLSCKGDSVNKSIEKEEVRGLKDVADFPIGSAISINKILQDEKLKNLHISNFSSVTTGNEMKMHNISPAFGIFNFENVDKVVQYANQNNQRLFGHTLIWHSATPKWAEGIAKSPEDLDSFMKD
jgi:endo-1,4-beta-xylanase